jgi:hypothetical protein
MRADQECGIHSARRIARGASRCTIWNPCTRVEKDQAFFASGAPGAVLKHRIPQNMGLSSRIIFTTDPVADEKQQLRALLQ